MINETQTVSSWQSATDSIPPQWTLRSLWIRYHADLVWLGVYVLANALVFWLRFRLYTVDSCVAMAPAIAKGSAEVVMLNVVLTILSVCHRGMDWLRRWITKHSYAAQRPLEMHRAFHVLTGIVVIVMSLVHSVAWGFIVHWSRTCSGHDWHNSALSTHPVHHVRDEPTLERLVLQLPMWTGGLMLCGALLLLPFGVGRVRTTYFDAFERVHRFVLIPFLVFLMFHGAAQWTSRLQAPLWLVPALVIYVVERRNRLSRYTNATILCFGMTTSTSAVSKTATTTTIRLFLTKTPRFLRCFEPGMFVYLQVPVISSLEWHPFSVSSSQDDTLIELRVRVVGDWTRQLCSVLETKTDDHTPTTTSLVPVAIPVRVDGPFGTPTILYNRYERVLLVAMGVGISPFLSVVRHYLHSQRRHHATAPSSLKIIWVVRDLSLVDWFMETLTEFDDVVSAMDYKALSLDVFVTARGAGPVSLHARVQCTYGRRPNWSALLREWLPSAVFVCGSHPVVRAVKHAAVTLPKPVDVLAERFH